MADLVTVAEAKAQCRIEASDVEEDGLVTGLLAAAVRSVEHRTGRTLSGEGVDVDTADLPVAKQAVLLLVGHWYRNREASVVGTTVTDLPMAVEYLTTPLARMAV